MEQTESTESTWEKMSVDSFFKCLSWTKESVHQVKTCHCTL